MVEDIASNIVQKNFTKSLELSKKWFDDFSLQYKGTPEYQESKEAYLLCTMFNSRLEQIKKTFAGKTRARFYLITLKKLNDMRYTEGFATSTESIVWRSFYHVLHKLSAKEFIFSFSGQEFHNLDPKEIILLVKSLIIIQNWTSAQEVLSFYLRVNRLNPVPIFLLSYIFVSIGKKENAYSHLRNALLLKPEILKDFSDHCWIQEQHNDLWQNAKDKMIEPQAVYYYFALLLESSVFIKFRIIFDPRDLIHIEQSFKKKYELFIKLEKPQDGSNYRISHLLCWLIQYYQGIQDIEKVNQYKKLLKSVAPKTLVHLEQMILKYYNDYNQELPLSEEP